MENEMSVRKGTPISEASDYRDDLREGNSNSDTNVIARRGGGEEGGGEEEGRRSRRKRRRRKRRKRRIIKKEKEGEGERLLSSFSLCTFS